MTQREIQSDPNVPDPNSTLKGPGFVAPIGLKGHFPPRRLFTPQVDLFQIEATNRDSIVHTGANGDPPARPQTSSCRSGSTPTRPIVPPGQNIAAPESYGFVSRVAPSARRAGSAPSRAASRSSRRTASSAASASSSRDDRVRHRGELAPQRRRVLTTRTSPTSRRRRSTSPSSRPAEARRAGFSFNTADR